MPNILRSIHSSGYFVNTPFSAPSTNSTLVRRDVGANDAGTAIAISLIVVGAVLVVAFTWSCVRRAHARAYANSNRRARHERRPAAVRQPARRPRNRDVEQDAGRSGHEMSSVSGLTTVPPPVYHAKTKKSSKSAKSSSRSHREQSIANYVNATRSAAASGNIEERSNGAPSAKEYYAGKSQVSATPNNA
ncbi:hypothetical protein LTR37_004266 [Vermiconidia calcicola]|uniref:Uncharacterized protein n=1 Tax=Vermiconidia calcicola TaxID=1690605 RepID=A0ACC3NNV6_9PEZI|nr:hypothetical protein LTR37_004266 [Vermiconidia calcicola]